VKATVFSQPNCVHCDTAKDNLMDLGIPFEEINVREDEKAFEYVVEYLGYRVTPVIEAEDGYTLPNPSRQQLKEMFYGPEAPVFEE